MEKKKGMDVILDPVAERLMAFVMEQGGPSKVAAKLEKHPQLFYNIRDGKSKPSMDTLREVKAAYGNLFDLDWVIMGTTPAPLKVSQGQSPSNPTPPTPTGADAIDWKDRFDALEAKYNDLLARYNRIVEMMMRKLDPSFNESDSLFTVYTAVATVGFEPEYMKARKAVTNCREMPLHDRTAIRVLNSLNVAEPVKLQA